MKLNKIITGLVILTSLVSCKDEKPKSEPKFFTVTLNVTAKNDDGLGEEKRQHQSDVRNGIGCGSGV